MGGALLVYTAVRGYAVPFTHDESFTYNFLVKDSFFQIISNNTGTITANNHVLNTLFMKLFAWLFGPVEWALRLQSLFAHLIYLIFSYRIVHRFSNSVVVIAGFILLNTNPYLLDFFSLARGYALAIALMMVSIYYLSCYFAGHKSRHLFYAVAAAFFSVSANFALLMYMTALQAIVLSPLFYRYVVVSHESRTFIKKALIPFAGALVTAAFCYEPIRLLIATRQLYAGGNVGFWHDTISSLIESCLYGFANVINVAIIKILIIVFALGIVATVLDDARKKGICNIMRPGFLSFLITVLIALISIMQHWLAGSKFLEDRFALFLFPLITIAFIAFFTELPAVTGKLKSASVALLAVAAILSVFHLARCCNIAYCYNWRYDAGTPKMLADLRKLKDNKKQGNIKLGITWYYEPAINFYKAKNNLQWLTTLSWYRMDAGCNYYYTDSSDARQFAGRPLVFYYKASFSALYD